MKKFLNAMEPADHGDGSGMLMVKWFTKMLEACLTNDKNEFYASLRNNGRSFILESSKMF